MIASPEKLALLTRVSAKVIDGAIIAMAVLGSMSYGLPRPLPRRLKDSLRPPGSFRGV